MVTSTRAFVLCVDPFGPHIGAGPIATGSSLRPDSGLLRKSFKTFPNKRTLSVPQRTSPGRALTILLSRRPLFDAEAQPAS
jgi:hypothetical protein